MSATDTAARGAGTAARWALRGLLAGWFSLTVAQQFHRRPGRLTAVDPVNVCVPVSTFFAPHPGVHDTHLLFRAQRADGTVTEWAEEGVVEERTLRQMLWHPVRRKEKVLFDAASELSRIVRTERRIEHLQLSLPYLSLLNFVTHRCPHPPDARKVQFMLVTSAGRERTEEPRAVFTSAFHDLDPDPGGHPARTRQGAV
ncbi:hypothetical protein [Streptomyces sp. JJ36]|uniref:hypothetical protein n=1 Tax=Streptomyces sp. JJ36 TaxID=2736645 RepID=UPI001F429A23|nr:hypothetical protein [Streptomyces sp. JJ36]MCF6522823.1 hypothetical protein [Streptomyces sp. JJ36]